MPQDPDNKAKIKRLARIGSLIRDRELLEKIGQSYRTFVLRRTRAGTDIHGHRFKPYSKGHASLRKRLGLETHLVNLQMSTYQQAMLEKVTHLVFKDLDGVKAFIDDPRKAQIGRYHAIEGAGKSRVIREWWGLSDDHIEKIQGLITTDLEEIFKTEL